MATGDVGNLNEVQEPGKGEGGAGQECVWDQRWGLSLHNLAHFHSFVGLTECELLF